jgi:hypothetical protein
MAYPPLPFFFLKKKIFFYSRGVFVSPTDSAALNGASEVSLQQLSSRKLFVSNRDCRSQAVKKAFLSLTVMTSSTILRLRVVGKKSSPIPSTL